MSKILLTAFALVLILEGCIPLLVPVRWREIFCYLTSLRDGQIRTIGLVSTTLGGVILLVLLSL
jgi:uncharacterized protein YjeT (DUF2065 family)